MFLIQENISLKPYNTFGIDVNARYFVEITEAKDLLELRLSDVFSTERILVIGGGSNLLFRSDFQGLIIKMSIPGIQASIDSQTVYVTAGAGVVWHDLVMYCVNNGYAGMENLSLIPGTAGASPIQNIGAYGVELMDIFYSCEAFELATGEFKTFSFEECGFAYRDSVFKHELKGRFIITGVTFRLPQPAAVNTGYGAIQAVLNERNIVNPGIADISGVVAEIRVSKLPDPSTIGNAGSFFKNPVIPESQFDGLIANFPNLVSFPAGSGYRKLAAGWLIEQCGFKGIRDGQTGTWKNQALVLVNHGGATGEEVYSFSEKIIEAVYAKFGLKLEREVNIL